MKICVVGAGAIGGLLAVKLAAAGHELSVIVRGANLRAVREHGLKLVNIDGSEQIAQVAASDRIADIGVQDVVVLGMKAHQLPAVVHDLPAIIGPQTLIVTAQNGVPWWYFHKLAGPYEGRRLESVDPGGVIAQALDANQVIGAIVYPAAELTAPGCIRHIEQNRFTLGELDGADTERVRTLAQAFREAGFKAPIAADIRSEIWVKLWGNCTFNPISALTHATLVDICRFPATRTLAAELMREAQAVGEALGVRFPISLERRIAGAEAVGAHKTSMLQDVESGRPMELGALVGSVIELGQIVGVPTPQLLAVHALASLLAAAMAATGGRLRLEAPAA